VARDERLARRAAVRAEQSPAGDSAARVEPSPAGDSRAAVAPGGAASGTADGEADPEHAAESDLVDLAALEARAAQQHADAEAAAAWPSAPVGPGWQPVPVPPPTYTLKPKAPAVVRQGQPLPGAPVQAAPAPGFDLDEILERRIASGA
jgi:hypothetical protein